MRTTQRDDAPVTGFFEFQLITRCKHRLGGEIYVVRLARSEGDAPFDASLLHGAITQRFRPSRQQRATFWSRWLRLHARISSIQPQIFEINPTPPRDFRVFTNGIKRNIRVLHPRHLRLNARDTRDGRLLARCANKRRVGYILVPENYTFLARILFRGYDENTRVCGDLEGRNLEKGFLENLFSQIGLRSWECSWLRHLATLFLSSSKIDWIFSSFS